MNIDPPASTSQAQPPGGARHRLDELLDDLDMRLVTLLREIAQRIVPTTTAFLEANELAAASLKDADATLATRCNQLEDAGYLLLAMQSPVATDLRRTIAVLRSSNNVLRSSNLLTHIVTSLQWVHPPSLAADVSRTIERLGATSAAMFERATVAWEHRDGQAATDLEQRDDEVDMLQRHLVDQLVAGPQSTLESITLGLIARYYERIADHAVSLTRHLTYYING
jgi:phosphate transport system protein